MVIQATSTLGVEVCLWRLLWCGRSTIQVPWWMGAICSTWIWACTIRAWGSTSARARCMAAPPKRLLASLFSASGNWGLIWWVCERFLVGSCRRRWGRRSRSPRSRRGRAARGAAPPRCTTSPRRWVQDSWPFYEPVMVLVWLILTLIWLAQRRRSRINEKMKALQSLIPNSSKVTAPFLSYSISVVWVSFVFLEADRGVSFGRWFRECRRTKPPCSMMPSSTWSSFSSKCRRVE